MTAKQEPQFLPPRATYQKQGMSGLEIAAATVVFLLALWAVARFYGPENPRPTIRGVAEQAGATPVFDSKEKVSTPFLAGHTPCLIHACVRGNDVFMRTTPGQATMMCQDLSTAVYIDSITMGVAMRQGAKLIPEIDLLRMAEQRGFRYAAIQCGSVVDGLRVKVLDVAQGFVMVTSPTNGPGYWISKGDVYVD